MEYFTERAATHREAMDRIREKYGPQAVILTHRTVRKGGIFGLFGQEGVEMTGYIAQDTGKKKTPDLEEEKKKILASVRNEQTLSLVLKEVQAIKEKFSSVPQGRLTQEEHPTVKKIEDLLYRNEFSPKYVTRMIARLKDEFPLTQLENAVLVEEQVVDWIGESISVYEMQPRNKPHIFILVGPTGVGKTTTIAKLAAVYGVGIGGTKPLKVRMITIDTYRIAAKEQIEKYGEIMEIPVSYVQSRQEFSKALALYNDVDLIFVDTIGKSPRDYEKLAEMQKLLDVCSGTSEIHLAVSATIKTSDIYELLQQFEPFRYQSVVVTKLDETARIGNILSVLNDKQKSISYITDGQNVPQDIEAASVVRLLMNLDGFRVNRQRIEKKFQAKRAMNYEWR